jgi:hypothetical protein
LDIPTCFYEFLNLKQFPKFKTIEKHLKTVAPYWAETGPRLQPTGRVGLLRTVGGKQPAWLVWPSGENGLRGPRQRARAGDSAAASQRQGVAGDLEGSTGEATGKEERAGVH